MSKRISERSETNIIRVQKNRENPYVMMNKFGLEDDRLSFKAKGLLAYLLSKPDDWKIRVSDLVRKSTDGETAIYSGLKELEGNGYLTRKKVRHRGKITHWENVIYEVPQNEKMTPQTLENSLLGENPQMAIPSLEKRDLLVNNDLILNNKTTTEPKKIVVVDSISPNENIQDQTQELKNEIEDQTKELKNEIEETIGTEISFKTITKLVDKSGIETVREYLDNWDKFNATSKSNVAGFFIDAVKTRYAIPKAQQGKRIENKPMANYKQREYTDEYYNSLYVKFE
jgi:hypothetical protein